MPQPKHIHQWLYYRRRRFYRSDKLHRLRIRTPSLPRACLFPFVPPFRRFFARSRIAVAAEGMKRLPSTDYGMLKALPRTSHPLRHPGDSRISEQSNGSVIRLSRFVDKILPSAAWWIWSVRRAEGGPRAMEGLNYDERISGKCTGVARAPEQERG